MKAKRHLFYVGILVLVIIGIFVGNFIMQKSNQESTKLSVVIDEAYAWYDLMPGASDSSHPHISIPLTIENKAGFDLVGLQIAKVEIIQEEKVVGDFVPWFQPNDGENSVYCNTFSDIKMNIVNLKDRCKLQFNVRAYRESDNSANIDPQKPIKCRFTFVNNYALDEVYETNEIVISETS